MVEMDFPPHLHYINKVTEAKHDPLINFCQNSSIFHCQLLKRPHCRRSLVKECHLMSRF